MKPILNRSIPRSAASQPTKPAFGQARAAEMQQRLAHSLSERRKLAAAQSAAQQTNNQPMQQAIGVRERLVEQRIDRLTSEVAGMPEATD